MELEKNLSLIEKPQIYGAEFLILIQFSKPNSFLIVPKT